jgi:hypothetical protein
MYKDRRTIVLSVATLVILATTTLAQGDRDIQELFLRLNQPKTTDRAAEQIMDVTRSDPGAREYVATRLSKIIDGPETNQVWFNAVRLAGQLKASETIPSLQKAFSRGPLGSMPIYSMTGEMRLENDVVAKSLSQMGDAAIPATRVLLESQAPRDRRRGVLILRNIGTPAARRLLQEHLPNENDPTNKQLIENGLDLQK